MECLRVRSPWYKTACQTLRENTELKYECFKYDDSNKQKLYTVFVNIMCNVQERKFDSQTLE